jgi:proteic killer suppression protein
MAYTLDMRIARLYAPRAGHDVAGHHAIWVTGNWRLTFVFEGSDVHLLDYLDYH